MRYWVTRLRMYTPVFYQGSDGRTYVRHEPNAEWPHPGYAEFDDGRPTGRTSPPFDRPFGQSSDREPAALMIEQSPQMADLKTAERRARENMVARHSGLRRRLDVEDELRGLLEKADRNGRLADPELVQLLIFWGIQVRAAEIIGQRFDLAQQAAKTIHDRLVEEAANRQWSQGLLNVIGTQVEAVFEKIATR